MGAGPDKNILAPSATLSTIRTRFLAKAPPRCLRLLPTRLRLRLRVPRLGMVTCTMSLPLQCPHLLRFLLLDSFFKAF